MTTPRFTAFRSDTYVSVADGEDELDGAIEANDSDGAEALAAHINRPDQSARIAELEVEVERLTFRNSMLWESIPGAGYDDDLPDGVTMQPTATGQWLIDNDPDGAVWERFNGLAWLAHPRDGVPDVLYIIRRRTPAPDVGTERITITIDKQTAVELTTGSSIVMDRAYLDLVDAATKALDGEV